MPFRNALCALALAGLSAAPALAGEYNLVLEQRIVNFTGRDRPAMTVNGTVPGPLLRFREGEDVAIHVTNCLPEAGSIHWHGFLIPSGMDGVPGLSFPGIAPGRTFTYRFKVKQSGTYWYHSHSGMQEQNAVYGPIIIDPIKRAPYAYDREYVVMLSDWTDEDPHRVLANLKKDSEYYNFQRRTAGDFLRDVKGQGLSNTISDRLMWGRMRMDPTDIADVTGATYTYLVNGRTPSANWTGLFRPGERVRLRFINGASDTYFDVRIPGLKLHVVQADGTDIQPVDVDEFRIAVAETYDVIIEPKEDRAYTIFAETMDRSGYARGTLAPRLGLEGPIPERRKRPLLTMDDMGMVMHGMDMGGSDGAVGDRTDMAGMGHDSMPGMEMSGEVARPSPLPKEIAGPVPHGPDRHGPGNSMVPMETRSRLDEPGIGLEDSGRRELLYADLKSLAPDPDYRRPDRVIELHLTGNMDRFMWSFDGQKYSDAGPIVIRYGERVRFILVNDTMMNHPIHLHGFLMNLVNGSEAYDPKKHTFNVKPAERLAFDFTADNPGRWAFHCHLLYHMDTGMFREVRVLPPASQARR